MPYFITRYISFELDGLSNFQKTNLRFFKIGNHPFFLTHHRQKRLSLFNQLPRLNGSFAYPTVIRGGNCGV
jgi:hypothetical protein